MLAVLAFALSFLSSNLVAEQIGNYLLQAQTQPSQEQTDSLDDNGMNISMKGDVDPNNIVINDNGSTEALSKDMTVEPLDIAVSPVNMAKLYLIGFIMIVFSVGISSAAVMRLKPREILVKMS